MSSFYGERPLPRPPASPPVRLTTLVVDTEPHMFELGTHQLWVRAKPLVFAISALLVVRVLWVLYARRRAAQPAPPKEVRVDYSSLRKQKAT